MFPDELRIGNWVQRIGFPLKVTGIKGSDIWVDGNGVELEYYFYDGINPIPLTEEWLVNFGFVNKKYFNVNIYQYKSFAIELNDFSNKFLLYPYNYEIDEIQHVHQLQNLYHALTGEELQLS